MVSYPCFALLLRNSVLKFTTMPRRYALIIIPIVALGLIGLPMARAANFTKGRYVQPTCAPTRAALEAVAPDAI